MKSFTLFLSLFLIGTSVSRANDVRMNNVSIINNGPGKITVKFDLSWENSWRINIGPANHDGVWVFFKYKTSDGKWAHINLTGSNNTIPSNYSIFQNSGASKVGAMIFRSSSNMGTGNVSVENIQLGVMNNLPYDIDVRGFALEMVYAPDPLFRPVFGDGDGTTESTNALHYADNTATNSAILPMKSDNNVLDDTKLRNDGIYVYSNDTIQLTNPIGPLQAFPAIKAVWCMKYELSQAGYRDFLNTLDATQQATRTENAPSSPRGTSAYTSPVSNYIVIDTPATATTAAVYSCNRNGNSIHNESNDGEWDACAYLNWPDLAAFLDWSGLAPMTELQYERLARGVSSAGANPAILGEFAWGDTTITNGSYSITGAGSANELASNASNTAGNANYGGNNSTSVTFRNGIFATASSNRRTSGASYYGIMEMSGNLNEYTIAFGNNAGRSCKYIPNGDGKLSTLGNAQLQIGTGGYWPGMEGNTSVSADNNCISGCEVTGFGGIRLRGGGASASKNELSISDRSMVFVPTARGGFRGGRGVLHIR